MDKEITIGSLIIVPIKNRWKLNCAAVVESMDAETVNAIVWNMHGPGVDTLVKGIPRAECMPFKPENYGV